MELFKFAPACSAGETARIIRAAQRGDSSGFTRLFESHYAGMRAVANQILGPGPDVDDVCQDAAITALGRIGELRDPTAVRSWLHAIVRNNCRTVLRSRAPLPIDPASVDELASQTGDPFTHLERGAYRDWVWHAMGRLSRPLRPVTMLRYFTENTSYRQIAALCEIPVGTVRSRLNEARRQLAAALPRVQEDRHEDAAALSARRRAEAEAILSAVENDTSIRSAYRRWADDLVAVWPGGRRSTGLDRLIAALVRDYDDGVSYRLKDVVAGPGITIWEAEFQYPPASPDPFPPQSPGFYPPAGIWLMLEREDVVYEARMVYTNHRTMPR